MIHGTDFNNVYVMCHGYLYGVDLIGQETILFDCFKKSIAVCERYLQTNLDYVIDTKKFILKVFNISNSSEVYHLKVNNELIEIEVCDNIDKMNLLNSIFHKIKPIAELSRLLDDFLIIQSENDLEINLIYSGNTEVIIDNSNDGFFVNYLKDIEIMFIATGMVVEYYKSQHSQINLNRVYLGTKQFDKIPDKQKQYNSIVERSNFWNNEFQNMKNGFDTFGY